MHADFTCYNKFITCKIKNKFKDIQSSLLKSINETKKIVYKMIRYFVINVSVLEIL